MKVAQQPQLQEGEVPVACSGQGECVFDRTTGAAAVCLCDAGFWTDDCSKQCCSGHGHCSRTTGKGCGDSTKGGCDPNWAPSATTTDVDAVEVVSISFYAPNYTKLDMTTAGSVLVENPGGNSPDEHPPRMAVCRGSGCTTWIDYNAQPLVLTSEAPGGFERIGWYKVILPNDPLSQRLTSWRLEYSVQPVGTPPSEITWTALHSYAAPPGEMQQPLTGVSMSHHASVAFYHLRFAPLARASAAEGGALHLRADEATYALPSD
eukprot:gene6584-12746_t